MSTPDNKSIYGLIDIRKPKIIESYLHNKINTQSNVSQTFWRQKEPFEIRDNGKLILKEDDISKMS